MGTGKLACFVRWATIALVLFPGGRAIGQEPPHPGLEPGQGNSEQNPTDAPIGLRWNWHPVFANRYMGLIAICIPPPHTLPEGRTWEIASTAPDWNMLTTNGHAQGLCIQVRHADFTIPDGSPFTVTVSERENGQIVESHTYYFKLYVYGGPLRRFVVQLADDKNAFQLHPKRYVLPGYSGPDSETEIFPNYCTDFNYNPHEFRAIADFKENVYSQKVNVFKFRPEWDQPAKVRIWYSLDEPGVFVNYRDSQQIEELNSEGGPAGQVNPRLTKGLPWTTWAKIASAPVVGSPDNTFTLVATYAYVSSVTGSEPVDGPPPAGVIDDTNSYFAYFYSRPNMAHLDRNHRQFADFRTHRPKDDLLLNIDGMTPWTPPTDYSGGVLFYRLLDHEGLGMPGVWIQERFGAPEEIPEDCRVNRQREYWVTQRKGQTFPQQASWENFQITTYPPFFPNGTADHGVFGPDYLWVANYHISGNEFLIHKHEYWAGTRATISNAGGTGPGIKLGSYTIRIVLNGGVTQIREDGG